MSLETERRRLGLSRPSKGGSTVPSPFPGMDPYLESRELWPDVHHRFISARWTSTPASTQYPRLLYRHREPGLGGTSPIARSCPTWLCFGNNPGRTAIEAAGGTLIADEPVRLEASWKTSSRKTTSRSMRSRPGNLITGIEFISPGNKSARQARAPLSSETEEVLERGGQSRRSRPIARRKTSGPSAQVRPREDPAG